MAGNPFDEALSLTRTRGLLLDTNVLAAWIAGEYDPSLLGHKKLEAFGPADFDLLAELVADASRLVTTPHLLAEASNIVGNCAGRRRAFDATARLGELVTAAGVEERHAPAAELVAGDPVGFARLGVSDAAIAHLAGEAVVVSADAELVVHLQAAGRAAVNFNHLRAWLFE